MYKDNFIRSLEQEAYYYFMIQDPVIYLTLNRQQKSDGRTWNKPLNKKMYSLIFIEFIILVFLKNNDVELSKFNLLLKDISNHAYKNKSS